MRGEPVLVCPRLHDTDPHDGLARAHLAVNKPVPLPLANEGEHSADHGGLLRIGADLLRDESFSPLQKRRKGLDGLLHVPLQVLSVRAYVGVQGLAARAKVKRALRPFADPDFPGPDSFRDDL